MSTELDLYVDLIEGLHAEHELHPAQCKIVQDIFSGNYTGIFNRCGRNFGKTEVIIYILWRWAKSFPGSANYYFSPFNKQTGEILWENRRLQDYGPRHWLMKGSQGINNTDMRLRFKNGSFVKADGSDSTEAFRGVKVPPFDPVKQTGGGIVVYDEFKDFKPGFYHSMDPNLQHAILIVLGTPPEDILDENEQPHEFFRVEEEFLANKRKAFNHFTSYDNPLNARDWLEGKRQEYVRRGELFVFEQEYLAKRVRGALRKIFSMLSLHHKKPHEEVMKMVYRERKKIDFFTISDPAARSVFASLFAGINRYSKTIYLLDEIYEQDDAEMVTSKMGQKILDKEDELFWGDFEEWTHVADEAEAWFANEMLDQFDVVITPTQKSRRDKKVDLRLIKDLLLQGKIVMSDRCKKLFWEMDNYKRDKNGKIKKEWDHLIDCLRYLLAAAGYTLSKEDEPAPRIESDPADERISRLEKEWETQDDDTDLYEDW